MALPVDEEGRRARNAADVGAVDVLGDLGRALVFAEVVRESLDVEPQPLRVFHQVARLERILVVEQQVVHLPEGPLPGRGFRRLRGKLGVWVDVAQRQMPPHVADVAEVSEQFPNDGFGLTAVRTLEVAVLDHGHRRLHGPPDVIPLRIDLPVEVEERLRGSEHGDDSQPSR